MQHGVELGHTASYGGNLKPMITLLAARPSHKWYYYPQLREDEALIFSQVRSFGKFNAFQAICD